MAARASNNAIATTSQMSQRAPRRSHHLKDACAMEGGKV
jgi:hypothetical protein